MSVDPNAGGSVPLADYARIAKQYFESAKSAIQDIAGAEPSKRETAILKEAGYRYAEGKGKDPLGRGWFDPAGNRISEDEAARRADELKRWQREGAEAREQERQAAESRKRVKERTRPSIPDTKKPPKIPGRVGRVIEAAGAVVAGGGILDILRGVELPESKPPPPSPPPPPKVDIPPGAEWMPRGPFVPSSPPLLEPPQPAPPPPKAEPAAPWEPLLLPVPVYSSPVPVPGPLPAPPSPATAMPGGAPTASAPTPPTAPLWKQALPFVLPLALSALTVPRGGSKRRDPLTLPQTPTLGSLQPTLASYPLPFPGSGFGGSGASTSTDTCECKPKGPRKRRRKRTVCYSGTYTEKASGIRKLKKRKVPCR